MIRAGFSPIEEPADCPLGTRRPHICAPYCRLKAAYLDRRRRWPDRSRAQRAVRADPGRSGPRRDGVRVLPPPPPWGVERPHRLDSGRCDIDWLAVPTLRSEVPWALSSIAGSCPVDWEMWVTPWWSAVPVRTAVQVNNSTGREWIRGWGALRLEVFALDRWRCLRCGTQNAIGEHAGLEADHVVAIVNGGRRRCWQNLQTLCLSCNRRKYTASDDYRSDGRRAEAIRRCRQRMC